MTQEFFLGIIAVATVTMAVVQVGGAVAALRLARRVDRLAGEVEREIKPIVAHATAVSESAARVAALALTQAERVDRLAADLSLRIDKAAQVLEQGILRPARQGIAVVRGIRAAVETVRRVRADRSARGRGRADGEEEPLFVG